jgi:hypothetical protein
MDRSSGPGSTAITVQIDSEVLPLVKYFETSS